MEDGMAETTARPLELGIATAQTEPFARTADRWRQIEALGFDSAWLFDHFMTTTKVPDHTYLEAWTALAGLAMVTSRVNIGILVSGNTYRPPALLAKEAVTIDHISNGRVIIGLGAGWHEPEHRAYGFFLPSPGERVSRFAEALQVIKALMTQERATFPGRYYQLDDAPFEPRPVRPTGIPITVGTSGPRMLGLVARYADRWNMVGSPEQIAERGKLLLEACAKVGRDPGEIVWSAAAWPGRVGGDPLSSVEFYRDLVGRYREAGVSEVICQWQPDLPLDAFERIAAEAAVLRGA
jgi:F420-dependent oxidoreductase-like protein